MMKFVKPIHIFLLCTLTLLAGFFIYRHTEFRVNKSGFIQQEIEAHSLLDTFLNNRKLISEAIFWQDVEKMGTPLIASRVSISSTEQERLDVTFLWRGDVDTQSVELITPIRAEDRHTNLLTNIEGTDIWFKTLEFAPNTALSYQFAPNIEHLIGTKEYSDGLVKAAIIDPLNSKTLYFTEGRFKASSLFFGPEAKEIYWSKFREGVARGKVKTTSFKSEILGVERDISIYLPPKISSRSDLPVVLVFDGGKYLHDAHANFAFDNLIHENKTPPFVGIFVHNTRPSLRGKELPCTVGFTNFLADEFMPWVRNEVPLVRTSSDIIVAGSSYGGLASACASLFRPGIFTHVLSQSGSYWWGPKEGSDLWDGGKPGWVNRQFSKKGCENIHFYFDAGQLEKNNDPNNIFESTAVLATELQTKGCDVTHVTFPGGHDLYFWRETLADGLIALIGDKTDP